MTTHAKQLGRWAEQHALQYLQANGWQCIAQNYYSRYGEIDLILIKEDEIVFVEVKARTSNHYGTASEMVTLNKQKKIIKTAHFFLQENPIYTSYYGRFDVVCFEIKQPIAKLIQQDFSLLKYDLQWIENAFA